MRHSNMIESGMNLGRLLRHRRFVVSLTLQALGDVAGVSPSHLARVERGERFPSASILRRIARPLGFSEVELFAAAGFLPIETIDASEDTALASIVKRLDPYVASVLAMETVATQRAVIGILGILKDIARKNQPEAVEPELQMSGKGRR